MDDESLIHSSLESLKLPWKLEKLREEIIEANSTQGVRDLRNKFREERRKAFSKLQEYV
jgi:predicted DNA-binding protein (UPF0278 family)